MNPNLLESFSESGEFDDLEKFVEWIIDLEIEEVDDEEQEYSPLNKEE